MFFQINTSWAFPEDFLLDRTSGSHHIYMLPDRSKRVIVPKHNKDIPKGTLISIIKQAGIDKSEL
ncbi:MAG: type II toxin-antitoxin system HicA family toxin [Chitinophagales bacterium]